MGDPVDPPKPGEGTKTGNWEVKNSDGSPSGIPAPATELAEVTIIRSKVANGGNLSKAKENSFGHLMASTVILSQTDGPEFGPMDVFALLLITNYYLGTVDHSANTTIGHYDQMSRSRKSQESKYGEEAEHTENARKSTEQKHEKGAARKGRDKGGEKGDARRTRYK